MGKIIGLIIEEPKVKVEGNKIIATDGKNNIVIDGDEIAKHVVKEKKK